MGAPGKGAGSADARATPKKTGATEAAARISSNQARHQPTPRNTPARVAPRARCTSTKAPDTASSSAICPSGLASGKKYALRSEEAIALGQLRLAMANARPATQVLMYVHEK